jgi:hypothetical protein
MQNERTTVLSDDKRQKVRKLSFSSFDVALCFAPRRTLVVRALVHHLEQLGVFVNHSRRSNRRGRRRHRSFSFSRMLSALSTNPAFVCHRATGVEPLERRTGQDGVARRPFVRAVSEQRTARAARVVEQAVTARFTTTASTGTPAGAAMSASLPTSPRRSAPRR